jgi:N-acyl homoserine lactone hydrolase
MKQNLMLATLAVAVSGCVLTTHAVKGAALGTPARSSAMLAVMDEPGPIEAETVASADWAVDRSGLINLDAPKAKAAGLKDGDEPIQIYFHVLHHPRYGTFIIDTGVEKALRDDRDHAAIRGLVAGFMHFEKMKFPLPLGDWLAQHGGKLDGVFFTHLHLDHVSGLPDVPRGTPLYAGPHETGERAFQNLVLQANIDRAFEGQAPLQEWGFTADPDGRFDGVVDVFGDGSLWAIWVPGHTAGSTAYLARTPNGPVLFTGDTCHTRWGWENGVEPGSFTADHAKNAVSLAKLRALAEEHPAMQVRLGHQAFAAPQRAAAATAQTP